MKDGWDTKEQHTEHPGYLSGCILPESFVTILDADLVSVCQNTNTS